MKWTVPLLALLGLLLAACGSKEKVFEAPANEQVPSARSSPPQAATPAPENDRMAAARRSLDAGEFDQAAARLFELRASGKEFSSQEAATYREILEEVYAAAVEANAKGDPRAPATLQLIKGATAR